jgi:hypothetical protein
METNNNLSKQNYINNLLNKYFNLFVVIFVSFLLFLSYSFLLRPKADETINAISENISSHEKLLQAEKNKLASLQAAVIAYNTINPTDLARVNAILPDAYDKEALYGELEEIIKKNGFIPTSITLVREDDIPAKDANNPKAAKPVTKVGVVNVTLDVASIDYAGAKKLLGILENNLRLIDIKDINLGGERSATFNFSTYYYKK